jgi:prephenate dehydrogenase
MLVFGAGKFGTFLANKLGCEATNDYSQQSDIIILAVPISAMKEVLNNLSLKPNQIIVDVCSVKEQPCQWMLEILPSNVEIVGSHPLFGITAVDNRHVVLCKVRASTETESKVANLFKQMSCEVSWLTPEEHDLFMAKSQTLAHLISRSIDTNIPSFMLTPSAKLLMDLFSLKSRISDELFHDMFRFNRFAKMEADKFLARCNLLCD